MARKYLVPIDHSGLESLNFRLQNLATAPGTTGGGRMYYNSTTNVLEYHNGTSWINPLARANHTGTQAFSTLTGLPTTLAGYGIGDAAPLTHVGTGGTAHADVVAAGASGFMSGADKTKLNGIATGATANATDAALRDRATHTGTQTSSTISNFDTQVRTSTLNQMAAPTTSLAMNSQKLTGLAAGAPGSNDSVRMVDMEAAIATAVQSSAAGIDSKASVRVVANTNITLSALQTVDGVAVIAGDRVLVRGQSTASANGVYVVAAGAWTRATDADATGELTPGAFWFVEEGTAFGKSQWRIENTGAITLGTTSITINQFGQQLAYINGNGLTLTGNSFAVGAGTGIVVDTTTVGIDTAVVVRKFSQDIGNNSLTSITVTHNLNTLDVAAVVREVSSGAFVECDVTSATINTITLGFAVAPATNSLRVTVHA